LADDEWAGCGTTHELAADSLKQPRDLAMGLMRTPSCAPARSASLSAPLARPVTTTWTLRLSCLLQACTAACRASMPPARRAALRSKLAQLAGRLLVWPIRDVPTFLASARIVPIVSITVVVVTIRDRPVDMTATIVRAPLNLTTWDEPPLDTPPRRLPSRPPPLVTTPGPPLMTPPRRGREGEWRRARRETEKAAEGI
jgi:hypothetical protein